MVVAVPSEIFAFPIHTYFQNEKVITNTSISLTINLKTPSIVNRTDQSKITTDVTVILQPRRLHHRYTQLLDERKKKRRTRQIFHHHHHHHSAIETMPTTLSLSRARRTPRAAKASLLARAPRYNQIETLALSNFSQGFPPHRLTPMQLVCRGARFIKARAREEDQDREKCRSPREEFERGGSLLPLPFAERARGARIKKAPRARCRV